VVGCGFFIVFLISLFVLNYGKYRKTNIGYSYLDLKAIYPIIQDDDIYDFMKKYFSSSLLLFFILTLLVLFSCGSAKKINGTRSENSVKSVSQSIVNELDIFLSNLDSLGKLEEYKIYALTFTKEKDNHCYFYISTAEVYNTDWWSGYFKYKGKMITVNEFDKDCSNGLVNDKYLLTSVEGDYHDQNWDSYTNRTFDPWGFKYLITAEKKLVLIKKGML